MSDQINQNTTSAVIARWAMSTPTEIRQGIELLRLVGSLDSDALAMLISHGEAIAMAKQTQPAVSAKPRRGRPKKQIQEAAS